MIVAGRGLNCQCERLAGEMNWVEGIWSGLLSVHLLAMNLASAGPLFAIWLWGMDKNRDSQRQQTGLRLIWLSIGALLLGAVLGYVQWLLLRQSGWAAAIAKLPTRALWFGLLELLFSLLCMVGLCLVLASEQESTVVARFFGGAHGQQFALPLSPADDRAQSCESRPKLGTGRSARSGHIVVTHEKAGSAGSDLAFLIGINRRRSRDGSWVAKPRGCGQSD